jgi:hypothetical protein
MSERIVTTQTDRLTKALEFFKDWSNYLLVTTVAAVGWTAGKDAATFTIPILKPLCVVALGFSAIFGIFTLALIPLVQEQRDAAQKSSNYDVYAHFWWWPISKEEKQKDTLLDGVKLKWVCLPQHVLFIGGIVFYVVGTTWP